MKSTKFYKRLSILLVLINIGTLAFIWFARPPHGPSPVGELAERLGINEHISEINNLEEEHHKKKRKLMSKDRKLHNQLFKKIGSNEDVTALREKIAQNYIEIELETYNFFDSVAVHCNKEQLSELIETVGKAFGQLRKPKGK